MIRIDGFVMDLALSEGHSFPGEATQYPVEVGADFSDHIRDLPEEIELECIVSDTPIGIVASDPSRKADAGVNGNTPLPSAAALEHLRDMKRRRRPVTIETSLGVFTSMACIGLDVPKDAARSRGLFFTVKFKKIVEVTNQRTKTRVKTTMPGAGGKPKAKLVVGVTATTVEDRVLWRHGNPPGAPFTGGLTQLVEVTYNKPNFTRDELRALGRVSIGSPFITYFLAGDATPIVGAQRAALVADLERDAREKRDQQAKEFEALPEDVKAAANRNLPPGLDLSRFQRQTPPTFGPTQKDLDGLSRFQRPPAVPTTFPGT